MTNDDSVSCGETRADARREQILAAAEACFREFGFHAASISRICKMAGMSPGHVYHYFENKEAIIEGIVQRKASDIQAGVGELRGAPDVLHALISRAGEGLADKLDPDFAALDLEILAEASRNPRVAEIVRTADRQVFDDFIEVLLGLRRDLGYEDSRAQVEALGDMIVVLFEGLIVRGVRHPELHREMLKSMLEKVLRFLVVDWRGVDGK